MRLRLHAVARSDRGLVRDGNEDSAYAGPHLIAVADGIGGLPAGEVASQLTIESLTAIAEPPSGGPLPTADDLRVAVVAANDAIRTAVDADPQREGMGTTLTALLLSGANLVLAHIGDSRAYRRHAGGTTRISRDDTYVQELVDAGVLHPDEIWRHPHRSVVTRALQGRTELPSWTWLTAEAGDRYLLCSDGLSDVVTENAIGDTLAGHPDLADCAERLVKLALLAGGPDNITVVVADVIAEEDPADE